MRCVSGQEERVPIDQAAVSYPIASLAASSVSGDLEGKSQASPVYLPMVDGLKKDPVLVWYRSEAAGDGEV